MLGSERHGRIQWALAACALCAYLACEEEETRPEALGDCDENCVGVPTTPYNPGVDGAGMGGSAGAGGGGGNAGSAGSSTGLLTGSVQAVVAPDLTDGAVAGAVKVRAAGASVQQVTVDAAADGTFRLEGVNLSPSLWVGVGPFTNDPTSTFVDTLQLVSSTTAAPVELLVMRRPVLEQIAQTGFLSNPLELDAQRGHVILRFLDQQRQGIGGASLIFPDPAETAIAYDLGDTYSDQVTETSTRGTLVLLNLASSAYPGIGTTVAANVRGMRRDVDLHTAAGAVTLVTAIVP